MGKPSQSQLVRVAVKTPMLEQPLFSEASGDLTLEGTVDQILNMQVRDATARRVQTQLARERTGDHSFIAFTADGRALTVPGNTSLLDIAVPKELIHPTTGYREEVSLAAFEIQSYAKVG